jgi:hypothetical protein
MPLQVVRKSLGLLLSLGAAALLLFLLHRALARSDVHPGLLMLGSLHGLGARYWAFPLAVAVGCAIAVVKRRPAALVAIQAWTLAGGFFLTQLALGTPPTEKFDPRLLLGFLAGMATLHGCYVCIIAHVVALLRGE